MCAHLPIYALNNGVRPIVPWIQMVYKTRWDSVDWSVHSSIMLVAMSIGGKIFAV